MAIHAVAWRIVPLLVVCSSTLRAAEEPLKAEDVTVLATDSLWRCRFVKGTELVRRKTGELLHVIGTPPVTRIRTAGAYRSARNEAATRRRRPSPPPAQWTAVDYDDSDWGLYPGPFSGSGSYQYRRTWLCPKTRLVYLRGRFQVTNPAEVPALTLSASFEGGIVVHLNGEEVMRAYMPEGPLTPETPAQDYPRDVYLSPEGAVLSGRDFGKYPERFQKRMRSLSGVTLPATLLREGLNVLAVELHHAPAPEIMYLGKPTYPKYQHWPRVGLESLELVAPPSAAARAHWRFRSRDGAPLQGFAGSTGTPTPARGAAVVPGAPRAPLPKGFRVWNHSTQQRLRTHAAIT